MKSNSQTKPNSSRSTSDLPCVGTDNALTAAQQEFARLLGRFLAGMWDAESTRSCDEPDDQD